jgi:hypothetical protein
MNIIDWYAQQSTPVRYGIPIAGTLGLGGAIYGLMNQGQPPQVVPEPATNAPTPPAPEYAIDERGMPYSVYGKPLSQQEALMQLAKLAEQADKFPAQKAKEIRQAEIEGRLLALQEEALRQQYFN